METGISFLVVYFSLIFIFYRYFMVLLSVRIIIKKITEIENFNTILIIIGMARISHVFIEVIKLNSIFLK